MLHYEIMLPNTFADRGTIPGTYPRFCSGVRIMQDGDTAFLQLVHMNDQSEKVSSYVLWEDGWKVIGQEIVPYG